MTQQSTSAPQMKNWRLDLGRDGMPRLVLDREGVFAEVYLNGAHVTLFENRARGLSMFWMDGGTLAAGRAIRGGVPLVFPWFGPLRDQPEHPRHGFARNLTWSVAGEVQADNALGAVALELVDTDVTRALWPHAFKSRLEVRVETLALEMRLITMNTGKAAFEFENALHSYFAVGDVRTIEIEGLSGGEYVDKTDGAKRKRQEGAKRFAGETDHVFVGATGACVIREQGRPALRIEKSGSTETVTWNPGPKKGDAAAVAPPFVCVEPANCLDHRVRLEAGEQHVLVGRFAYEG